MNFWKPYFIHRPKQLWLRLARQFWRPSGKTRVSLPWGGKIFIHPQEAIGRAIWLTGVHEIATTEAIFRLLPRGGCGVDVGANIGYMTSAMIGALGNCGHVLACEPHPGIFCELEDNTKLNMLSKPAELTVSLLKIALSESEGSAGLCLDPMEQNQGSGSLQNQHGEHHITVPTMRLDAIVDSRSVDVLKIDVEGHEMSVLQGAEGVLAGGRVRHIIFENHDGEASPIPKWLKERGYSIFKIGWSVRGPILEGAGDTLSHLGYQAPDYLATLDSEHARHSFSHAGWRCLRPLSQ
jgi:FkbM family methyltransferase